MFVPLTKPTGPAHDADDAARPALPPSAGRWHDALYLLVELRRRGYSVTPNGDGLTVGPASRLNEGEREEITTHKGELVALLFEGR
jgi:hypothetical protein